MNRKLSEIAKDILQHWKNPYFGAKPYIQAMLLINSAEPYTPYLSESAEYIKSYFLANATSFRGEDARRIKAELKKQYHIK